MTRLIENLYDSSMGNYGLSLIENDDKIGLNYKMNPDIGEGKSQIYSVKERFLLGSYTIKYKGNHNTNAIDHNHIRIGLSSASNKNELFVQNPHNYKQFFFHRGNNEETTVDINAGDCSEFTGFIFLPQYYNNNIRPITNMSYEEFSHVASSINNKHDTMQLNTLLSSLEHLPFNSSYIDILLETKLMDIISNMLLIYERSNFMLVENKVKRKEYEQINTAKEYIKENYMNRVSLDDLVKHVFMSKRNLTQTFKKVNGITISEYIYQIRIEKAKELLILSDKPIKEIAYLVGYEHRSSFSRTYSRLEGITPREFRLINRSYSSAYPDLI